MLKITILVLMITVLSITLAHTLKNGSALATAINDEVFHTTMHSTMYHKTNTNTTIEMARMNSFHWKIQLMHTVFGGSFMEIEPGIHERCMQMMR